MTSDEAAAARTAAKDRWLALAESRVDLLVSLAHGHKHEEDETCVAGCIGRDATEVLLNIGGCNTRTVLLLIALQGLSKQEPKRPEWGARWPGETRVFVCSNEVSAIANAGLGRPDLVGDDTPGMVVRFNDQAGGWVEVDYPEPEMRGRDA